MSLRGSLDTFALPDVLALLATTAKSGELHVSGSSGGGQVWVESGQVTGAEAAGTTTVVDVLVHLLRLDDGDFTFHADRSAPEPTAPVEVAALLEQAAARLAEWREVEELLPSPSVLLTLAAAAPGPVRLSREQWAAVAAVGDGRTVEELAEELGGDELGRWRLLANLVEAGLVEVGEPSPVAVAPVRRTAVAQQLSTLNVEALADDDDSDEALDVAEDPVADADAWPTPHEAEELEADRDEPAADEPADAPVVAAAQTVDSADGVSRGTLLKFLSSVRT
jgi:hypothetical protein